MDRHRRAESGAPTDGSPPSEAWLFAQAILGKPIPRVVSPETKARVEREELKRLAKLSTRHAAELQKLEAADAQARHDREVLEFAALISSHAEEKLRALQRKEAADREGWQRAEQLYESYCADLTEWNETDHPRQPAGSPQGGQFAPKGGGGSAGFFGSVNRRNQTVSDLTGIVTPGMVHSSRLAATLKSAARLPGEITRAASAGLVTGGKAVVNGSATAVKNVATLGLSSTQLELIGVTKEDRARGYDTAVTIATASGQVLVAVGTSGLAAALSKGGTVARAASGALVAYDAAGNAVGTVQGAYDASQNGVNLENGLKIAGGALGLAANAKAARGLSQAASTAELEKVETYIAKCPRTRTPTKSAANQYEIAHTGPHNYTISGGGAKFDIDGYRGTAILEAKHVADIRSSPYVPGSSCYEAVREKALNKVRDELRRARAIIRSGETPFKSVEIITNTPESKALFEGMLNEASVPGTVRLAI
jgi:hypothetical protein